jgi:hypothetical protein
MRRRRIIIASACVLGLGRAIAIFIPRAEVRVISHDPSLGVVAAGVLRGPNDKLYLGNQIEGRARDFLRKKVHLKISAIPAVTYMDFLWSSDPWLHPAPFVTGPLTERCALAIAFKSRLPGSIFGCSAELFDEAGQSFPVPRVIGYHVPGWGVDNLVFDLDAARTNGGNYHLRLRGGKDCVAEFELRNLPPVVWQVTTPEDLLRLYSWLHSPTNLYLKPGTFSPRSRPL